MTAGWRFTGRATELALLRAALTDEPARRFLVSGPAGIGKSRLLREAIAALDPAKQVAFEVTGTMAGAPLPFGAFATVLPAEMPSRSGSPGVLLDWAAQALARQAGGRRMVLAVDDVPLLDHLSVALLLHLQRHTDAALLGTQRTGEPLPPAADPLWSDRLDLAPLGTGSVAELLRTVCAADYVEYATVTGLHAASEGNALLLRELILAARAAGSLEVSHGVCRWTGDLPLSPRLRELIEARIGRLDQRVRRVVELVAFGEPVGLGPLIAGNGRGAVDEAFARDLLALIHDGDRIRVRIAHPVYGEVIRANCPPSRRIRRYRALAEAIAATGARRHGDVLRVALWQLESGGTAELPVLMAACAHARATFHEQLAIRFGAAAVAAGGGLPAAVALAVAQSDANAPADALAGLAAARPLAVTEADRGRFDCAELSIRFWSSPDPLAVLDDFATAYRGLTEPRWIAELQAREALARAGLDQPDRALALAARALRADGVSPDGRAIASAVMALISAARGEHAEALRVAAQVRTVLAASREAALYQVVLVELAQSTAQFVAGDVAALATFLDGPTAAAITTADFRYGTGLVQLLHAQHARFAGQVSAAVIWAAQAVASFPNGLQLAAMAHGELAHAAALTGQVDLARRALSDADALRSPRLAFTWPWVELARPWVAWAAGARSEAVELAHTNATHLRAAGARGHELLALHDLVRLGQPGAAVPRLNHLALELGGALAPACARHAKAAADRDSARLLDVATEFADFGQHLYAAGAAAAAEATARRNRAPGLAAILNAARAFAIPGLRLRTAPALSGRERHVAQLASRGLSSRRIGERLGLSARTVDNHLASVYRKLGIAGRDELATVIDA